MKNCIKKMVTVVSAVAFCCGCNSGSTNSLGNPPVNEISRVTPKLKTINDEAVFNTVIYDEIHKMFIGGGNKGLLANSVDGIHWKEYHTLNQRYTITGLHVSKTGEIYCTDATSSLWRVSDTLTSATLVSIGRDALPIEGGTAKTSLATYEVFKMGDNLFQVVRRPTAKDDSAEEIRNASRIQTIYSGANIVGIAAADMGPNEIVVIQQSQKIYNNQTNTMEDFNEALVSTTPSVSNSFKLSVIPNLTNIKGIALSLSGGSRIVAMESSAVADRTVDVLEPSGNSFKWLRDATVANSFDSEEVPTFFADIAISGGSSDEFMAVTETPTSADSSNDNFAVLTGSIDGNERLFHYKLSRGVVFAKRTCAAGAVLGENEQPVLVILGEDNKVLYSKDNKSWHLYKM